MDNNYKWIRLLTLNGWVSLNTESIESTDRISPVTVRIRTTSGNVHLLKLKSQIKKLQEKIPVKI